MNIFDIYATYSIPLNLQRHMLGVAVLASAICDLFPESVVNKELIVKTSLLHDMGNVLKFNFSRIDLFYEGDREKIEQYKITQQQLLAKYGSNPDQATLQIIKEITNDDAIEKLCADSHWERLGEYISSDRWDIKICCYSDMRTGPSGLLTLPQTIADLKLRRPEESDQLDVLLQHGLAVEKQLDAATGHRLREIDDRLISRALGGLKNKEI